MRTALFDMTYDNPLKMVVIATVYLQQRLSVSHFTQLLFHSTHSNDFKPSAKLWIVDGSSETCKTGYIRLDPKYAICKNVLYFEIAVGRTSADGSEKSQNLRKVFGGGKDTYL